jgi:hypothetical protein
MMAQTLEAEIREQLNQLPVEQQRWILEFARSLVAARVRGVPGKTLLRFAGAINTDDLTAMKQAIEEGCEQVSLNDVLGELYYGAHKSARAEQNISRINEFAASKEHHLTSGSESTFRLCRRGQGLNVRV